MADKRRKKYGRWILLAAIIVLLIAIAANNINLYRVHYETRRLQHQIQALNHSIDSLSAEIIRLRSDTSYIEKIARERLGMARRDEKVYKFVEENK